MNTLHVTIVRNEYNSCFAMLGNKTLFQFEYRHWYEAPGQEAGWLCWLRGSYNPRIFHTQAFPRPFFDAACLVKAFVKNDMDYLPKEVVIDAGEQFLTDIPPRDEKYPEKYDPSVKRI